MSQPNYDSEFCGKLPIHLINAIQPHGVLLVVDRASKKIIQGSENVDKIFKVSVASLIGTSLSKYLTESQDSQLVRYASTTNGKLPLMWTIEENDYLVLVHPKKEYYIIEIELTPFNPDQQDSFIKVFHEIRLTMSSIDSATTIQEACDIAARELKQLSGFDKVMIYTFDRDWNGTVITELKEEGMESYFGYTFPASDIPRQAREMYQKNPYRLIPNREYQPVRLYPAINPSSHTLIDLSDCNLRAVAAVHLEYLTNMGVVASMSTRIVQDNQSLWGLIACHHRTPKYLSYQLCAMFEMVSGILSSKISTLISRASHDYEQRLQEIFGRLIQDIYRSKSAGNAMLSSHSKVLHLFNATGLVVSVGGEHQVIGDVPEPAALDDLLLWLHTRELRQNLYTECLAELYEPAADYRAIGSGLMALPIDVHSDQYILIFRQEVIQTISWGGNPEERIQLEKDNRTYHPRSSFKQWRQQVLGHAAPWRQEEIRIAEKLRSFIIENRSERISLRKN